MSELVRAAGGIVLRGAAEDRSVALVHRPRYDDWSFPKGKLVDGEDEASAALREVEEETGLRCQLGPVVGAVAYRDPRGRPKVVRYFRMDADGGGFQPSAEVDELRWVPVDEASSMLSYPHDRNLLSRVLADAPVAPLYLIRHAKAGLRSRWRGPDQDRPLTRRGRKQALRLVGRFQGLDLGRIVSSPFLRCVQTVEPLAAARGLPIERAPDLAEETPVGRVRELIGSFAEHVTAVCGHRTELEALIHQLGEEGAAIDGSLGLAKGSVWVLDRERDRIVSARHLPAPPA